MKIVLWLVLAGCLCLFVNCSEEAKTVSTCESAADGDFLATPCSPGGLCPDGIIECTPDGVATVCSTSRGGSEDATFPELCDGVDSDCDGEVDEGWPQKDLACDGIDLDTCASGTWTCSSSGELECVNETGVGGPEVCDGEDNDCNGLKDDGLTYEGQPLNSPCDGIGACGEGTVECNGAGAATCSTNGDGSQSQALAELCDGIDNDCDGLNDNGLSWNGIPMGDSCDGFGQCGEGTVECSPIDLGTATCSTNPNGSGSQASAEICDNLDNNCDGQTDEGNPGGGIACDGDDADGCRTGTPQCELGGNLVCLADIACALNAACFDLPGGNQQLCTCLGAICSERHGNDCVATGCQCDGGPPCNVGAGLVCVPGSGCVSIQAFGTVPLKGVGRNYQQTFIDT